MCSLGDGGQPEHGNLEGKSGSGKNETLVCCYVAIFTAGCVCMFGQSLYHFPKGKVGRV